MTLSFVRITGAQLVGVLLAWGVFGVLTSQVHTYSEAFSRDRIVTKCLVYVIYLIQAVQLLLLTHAIFNILASGFGDLRVLSNVELLWLPVFIMEGIVTSSVQSFYGWRIASITGSKIPMVLILLLSLTSLAFSIILGVRVKSVSRLFNILDSMGGNDLHVLIGWTAISTGCDLMIAGCMTYCHLRKDVPTGPERLDRVTNAVNRFLRSAIATGSFMALAAIINLGLVATVDQTGIAYIYPIAVISGLHANTMLVLLNGRIRKYLLFRSYSTDCGNKNIFASLDGMGDRSDELPGRDVSDDDAP